MSTPDERGQGKVDLSSKHHDGASLTERGKNDIEKKRKEFGRKDVEPANIASCSWSSHGLRWRRKRYARDLRLWVFSYLLLCESWEGWMQVAMQCKHRRLNIQSCRALCFAVPYRGLPLDCEYIHLDGLMVKLILKFYLRYLGTYPSPSARYEGVRRGEARR